MGLGTPPYCLFGGNPTLKKKRGRGVLLLYTQVGHRPATETGSVVEGGQRMQEEMGFQDSQHCCTPWRGKGEGVMLGAGRGRNRCVLCTAHCCTLVLPGMGGWKGKSWGRDRCARCTAHVVPPSMGGSGKCCGRAGGGTGVHCTQPTVA